MLVRTCSNFPDFWTCCLCKSAWLISSFLEHFAIAVSLVNRLRNFALLDKLVAHVFDIVAMINVRQVVNFFKVRCSEIIHNVGGSIPCFPRYVFDKAACEKQIVVLFAFSSIHYFTSSEYSKCRHFKAWMVQNAFPTRISGWGISVPPPWKINIFPIKLSLSECLLQDSIFGCRLPVVSYQWLVVGY